MAIVKSRWAKGTRQTARPQTAANTHVQHFIYDVGAEGALAVGDILELGILPPYCRVTNAVIATEGVFTGLTADVGLMTGEVGADLNPDGTARTSGNEFFAATDLTLELASLAKKAPLLLAPVDYERSIGVKVSAAVPLAAGKRIHFWLHYHQ